MTTPISTTGPQLAATGAGAVSRDKLKSAAQAFEAVFLRQMIGSMRQASLGDGMFDSQATEQFRDMSDGKTADAMAREGVLGVADMLVKSLGGAAPQIKAAGVAADAAGRVAHVAGDIASRFKL